MGAAIRTLGSGRVKMASKKNFMLRVEAGNDKMEDEFGAKTVLFRFGKVQWLFAPALPLISFLPNFFYSFVVLLSAVYPLPPICCL